jgi:hypothetical protein
MSIKSLIPGYKKEDVEEYLYRPHPQVQFADLTIPNRIREFDEQIQCSTALLIRAQEMLGLYRHVPAFPKHSHPPMLDIFRLHYNNLKNGQEQLKDRLSLLKGDKSCFSALKWIKEINQRIEKEMALLPYFYDAYHRVFHECTVEGLEITSSEEGHVTTRRPDGSVSAILRSSQLDF